MRKVEQQQDRIQIDLAKRDGKFERERISGASEPGFEKIDCVFCLGQVFGVLFGLGFWCVLFGSGLGTILGSFADVG